MIFCFFLFFSTIIFKPQFNNYKHCAVMKPSPAVSICLKMCSSSGVSCLLSLAPIVFKFVKKLGVIISSINSKQKEILQKTTLFLKVIKNTGESPQIVQFRAFHLIKAFIATIKMTYYLTTVHSAVSSSEYAALSIKNCPILYAIIQFSAKYYFGTEDRATAI